MSAKTVRVNHFNGVNDARMQTDTVVDTQQTREEAVRLLEWYNGTRN